jgi:hypothetical protein
MILIITDQINPISKEHIYWFFEDNELSIYVTCLESHSKSPSFM